MRRIIKLMLCILIISSLMFPYAAFARGGDNGYEGGISSGEAPGKTSYEYQEVNFITGEPIVFKGTLVISKNMKKDTLVTTYRYTLNNLDRNAVLNREITLSTQITTKDNGQTVEESLLDGRTSELVRVGSQTYILENYDFSRSRLVDHKPAIDYYAGNLWGKKTYRIASGTGTVTVEETGSFYGYDQYWGSAEAMEIKYVIDSRQKKGNSFETWSGTASVTLSSTVVQDLKYEENVPDQISFSGGYVKLQNNESILEYSCSLPEFDQNGFATDNMLKKNGSLKLESFPSQTRLPVANISHLRGHWAENDIKALYSLEVFNEGSTEFNPDKYITRAEFAAVMVRAAKEVPEDESLKKKTVTRTVTSRRNTKEEVVSPFIDVKTTDKYYKEIEEAYKRGLMGGNANGRFEPNQPITVAEALTVFIRALGLESLAPNPNPVTSFANNDKIPAYARKAVYVAQRIGLIKGDIKGYLNPEENLTMGRAAVMVKRFIDYMRSDIRKDYRERIINY